MRIGRYQEHTQGKAGRHCCCRHHICEGSIVSVRGWHLSGLETQTPLCSQQKGVSGKLVPSDTCKSPGEWESPSSGPAPVTWHLLVPRYIQLPWPLFYLCEETMTRARLQRKTFNWLARSFRGLVHCHDREHGDMYSPVAVLSQAWRHSLAESGMLTHRQQEDWVCCGLLKPRSSNEATPPKGHTS